MYATVIYKEIIEPKTGNINKIDIIEIDEDENNAIKYSKLYGLQTPVDEKNKYKFKVFNVQVR